MEILGRTPAVLRALLDLSEPWVNYREGSGGSPKDVLAHLIHGDRTDWIPRARIILEHGEAVPFPSFDRTAHLGDQRPLATLLDEFATVRAENLGILEAMALEPSVVAAPIRPLERSRSSNSSPPGPCTTSTTSIRSSAP